jgi:serine/threonine-protein kinase
MAETKIGIGTLINNRYQIQEILGQGGFGRTYLAFDIERFNEECVLKEFVPTNAKRYATQKARELFEREARILYKINHPQIPKFLALFESFDSLFIVQEYIQGKTYFRLLSERLSYQRQPFSQIEVSQWLQDLLPVLDYLHRNDIVHRDISLDNIMLPDGQIRPVLIDFGLVKQRVSQIWELTSNNASPMYETSFVGKLGYSPPEQIRMGQCYPCSDLYSLAVSAIVLLTGKEPSSLMDRSLEWQWRSYVEVGDRLAEILDKMLAEKPDNRYQSAQEILALLQPEASTLLGNERSLQFELQIDETNKNLQIAEIEGTDYFKELQAQADFLRSSLSIDANLQFPSDLPVSTLNTERSLEATEPHFLEALQPAIQAETFSFQFDSDFLERCQQTLSRYIGVMATCILEDTIDDNPDFSKEELIEALAAEIPNPQQSVEFKQSLSIELNAQPVSAFSKITEQDSFGSFQSDVQSEVASTQLDLPQLDSIFLTHCQQALSRYIGVMATCILEDTIDDNPDFSKEELIEALAAEIPNPQQAAEFKQIMTKALETPPGAENPQQSIHSSRRSDLPPGLPPLHSATHPKPATSFPLTQALADRCQQELTRYIGPMARYLVEDTLEQIPNLSVQQLIEILAEEIPNPKQAEEFRQRLSLTLKP